MNFMLRSLQSKMQASFDYFIVPQVNGQLDIDDISNFAIRANNDLMFEYYLIVKTELGQTKILEYGPLMIDIEDLPSSVSCKYTRMNYDEKKIMNAVNKFLNDSYKAITQASLISYDECKSLLRNMIDFI